MIDDTPSEGDRLRVKLAVAAGNGEAAIARNLRITLPQLRRRFAAELKHGLEDTRLQMSLVLLKDALEGTEASLMRVADYFDILKPAPPPPPPPPVRAAVSVHVRERPQLAVNERGQFIVGMNLGDPESRRRIADANRRREANDEDD